MPSPTKASDTTTVLKSHACVDLCAPPLSPGLAALGTAAPSLVGWTGVPAVAMLREEEGYPRATIHVPAWIVAEERPASAGSGGSKSAATLFLGARAAARSRPAPPGLNVPWACFPELFTTVREPFHPAYNGEVKSALSAGDTDRPHMFDELATYAMLGILGSYFRGVPAGAHRFFRAPPHAFCLAAFPHVGYLIAAEWVGKLFLCAASEPFFLGSPAHAAAVARLPDSDLAAARVDVPADGVAVAVWPAEEGRQPGVLWRTQPPAPGDAGDAALFFKIIRAGAFPPSFFRGLAAAYVGLAAACADEADPPPPAIARSAELLFGAGEVCVRMRWARGREAAPVDLSEGGCATRPVAAALAWLARHCLLYVDMREPNVLIDDEGGGGGGDGPPRVTLIDYDDMVVAHAPPADADELFAGLAEHGAAFVAPEGSPGARPALVAELRRAWRGV